MYQQLLMNSRCLHTICYKLRDDGVSRLLVMTVRQRKVWWCGGCRRSLPWAV